MVLKNGFILDKSFKFITKDVVILDGKIVRIANVDKELDGIDCTGQYIIPGLVDIHTHGCGGFDTCDGTNEALDTISTFQGKAGITSFCPTTMTLPEYNLEEIFTTIGQYVKSGSKLSNIVGVNMEGPFFNGAKKGAQRGDCLKEPNIELFNRLNNLCGNIIKLVDLSPELDGAMEFIRDLKGEVTISLAHTAADYDTSMNAILAGASHITHLYNAMDGLLHRYPGLIGAAFDSNVTTELICDGIHVDPCMIRIAFNLMNDRVVLISDSISSTGMPDGEYDLGGQPVSVVNKKSTLPDGTIAGSSTNLADCMRKAVEFGIPLETSIKAATFNPAKSIGLEKQIGSIDIGLDADLIIMDKDMNFNNIYFKGNPLNEFNL